MKNRCYFTIGVFLLIGILAPATHAVSSGADTWYKPDFHYRLRYSVAHYDPTRSPGSIVALSIDLSALFPGVSEKAFAVVNPMGADLLFYISQWSPSHKKVTLWVALDESSNTFFVYTGKTGSPTPADGGDPNQVLIHKDSFPQANGLRALPGSMGSSSMKKAPWIEGWITPLPDKKIGPSLFIDRNTIIAATLNTGKILISKDRGRTWTEIYSFPKKNTDPKNLFITRLFYKDSQNNLYVSFDGNDALYRSHDLGSTWQEVLTIADVPSRDCRSTAIRSIRSLTELPNGQLLAGVYSQEPGACAYFYRSLDQGQSWAVKDNEPIIKKLNNLGRHVHFVSADPYHPGRMYAGIGDGARASKILRSDDSGNSWQAIKDFDDTVLILKKEVHPFSASEQGFRPSYWQPTSVEFDDQCRLFAGDLEFDPIIHRSCEVNEPGIHVVFRPQNEAGYYYGSTVDRQQNHYFGFFANPRNNLDPEDVVENSLIKIEDQPADMDRRLRREPTDSFIVATNRGQGQRIGDLWQVVSFVGQYPYNPQEKGFASRKGVFGMSNFVEDTSLVATAEGKTFLLESDPNTLHDYLDVPPGGKMAYDFHWSSLPANGVVVVEFDVALNKYLLMNIFTPEARGLQETIPLPSLVDGGNRKILGTSVGQGIDADGDSRKDDGYVILENGNQEKVRTGYSFFVNTWHRFQFQLDLDRQEARLCFPGHLEICSPPISIPAKFDLKSLAIESPAGVHTLLKQIRVYRYVENQMAQYIHPNVIGYHDGKWGAVPNAQCLVVGWACDRNQPGTPLDISVMVDGKEATTIRDAKIYRDGTRDPKYCNDNGLHGYSYPLPERYHDGIPHRVETFALVDGIHYPITPGARYQNATITCPR